MPPHHTCGVALHILWKSFPYIMTIIADAADASRFPRFGFTINRLCWEMNQQTSPPSLTHYT